MINKNINYILLGLLVFIILQGFFKPLEGVSEEEVLYQLKIQQLNRDKVELMNKNNELENKIKSFKDEIFKNDSIINNYSIEQLDSTFAEYFSR